MYVASGHQFFFLNYVLHRKWLKANESQFEKILTSICFATIKSENGPHRPKQLTKVKKKKKTEKQSRADMPDMLLISTVKLDVN